jgi:hypothetical protein
MITMRVAGKNFVLSVRQIVAPTADSITTEQSMTYAARCAVTRSILPAKEPNSPAL